MRPYTNCWPKTRSSQNYNYLNVNSSKKSHFYFFSTYFKDVEQTTARHCKRSSLGHLRLNIQSILMSNLCISLLLLFIYKLSSSSFICINIFLTFWVRYLMTIYWRNQINKDVKIQGNRGIWNIEKVWILSISETGKKSF